MPPEIRALLALFEQIPYSQRDGEPDRIMITLRSSRTLSEMVYDQGWDASDPATRWHHGTAIEAAERDPDGYWEQDWPINQPRPDSHAADWTVEQWAEYESAQFPAGFYPIHIGLRPNPGKRLPEGMAAEIRDELRSGSIEAVRRAAQEVWEAGRALDAARAKRDAAIRSALAAGVRQADLVEPSGVKKGRISQLAGK